MKERMQNTMNGSNGTAATRIFLANFWAILALFALALSPVLRADDPGTDTRGPAARAVRLSSVDGQVQLSQKGQILAASAVANTPLFEATRVTTGDDGRAEIQFEDGSVARISPNSSLVLTQLRGVGTNGQAEITLEGGLGYFEIQGADQIGTITVKFGDGLVTASGFSVLRVNLDNPPGSLSVFSGNAHLERGDALAVDVHGGESVALSADDISRYTVNESIEPDSWDAWNSDRDQVLSAENSAMTAASKGSGESGNPAWSDLDANGNWYNVPGEGNVWSPYDASNPDWDPYGNGDWMYTPAYGYSWVSGNSWGYLPYQCGLWNWYEGFGWGWGPGAGGCNPWWGRGGFGYFVPNVGVGYGGYRPPRRPVGPRRPLGGMIAVNRHLSAPVSSLPVRDKTTVVSIAGHSVTPMRAVSPRLQYDHGTLSSGSGGRTVVTYVGGRPAAQAYAPGTASGAAHPGPASARPASAPAARPSAPAPARASAPPPASHASGGVGGGGGGGGHAGGGGGGHH